MSRRNGDVWRDNERVMWPSFTRAWLVLSLYWGHWEGVGGRRDFRVGTPQGLKVSLSVVIPALDYLIELVTWRESALHIPVSFDLIVGSQEALRHPTFQKI